jgi:hypothetical protein
MSVPKRFAILRFFGSLLKVLAWIFLVLSILGAIGAVVAGTALLPILSQWIPEGSMLVSMGGGIVAGIVSVLIGLLYFVLFYAFGEYVQVSLAVEENTRLTAALLLRMHQDSQVESPPAYAAGGFTSEPFEG